MPSTYTIIRRPMITEKALGVKETESTLVFEVELLDVKAPAAPKTSQKSKTGSKK